MIVKALWGTYNSFLLLNNDLLLGSPLIYLNKFSLYWILIIILLWYYIFRPISYLLLTYLSQKELILKLYLSQHFFKSVLVHRLYAFLWEGILHALSYSLPIWVFCEQTLLYASFALILSWLLIILILRLYSRAILIIILLYSYS
jgi:hypothetical protein